MEKLGRRVSPEQAPAAQRLTVAVTVGDSGLAGHLANLGWRVGRPVTVLRRTAGGGRVIDLDGGRIALSRQIARSLVVEAQDPAGR